MKNISSGFLYVPEAHWNSIAIIDCKSNSIINRLKINDIQILPFGSRPTVLVPTSDGKKIYSDNFGAIPPSVSCIDTETNTVSTIVMSSIPLGISISLDDNDVYLPLGDRTVEVLSTKDNKIIRKLSFHEIPLAVFHGPKNQLYISFASGEIGIYDRYTGELVKPLINLSCNLPAWFTFSIDNKKIYIAAVEQIIILDINSWRVIKRINLSTYGENNTAPWAFLTTLAPKGNKLYISLLGASKILVMDIKSEQIINEIKTAGSTTGVTFNKNGTLGYISDMGASLSFLKGFLGGLSIANAWIGYGIIGNGQIIVFDPETDEKVNEPIITAPAPGISAWISN